jgi:16S rRNA (uracil1498-N3)-methyltransferase
MQAIMPATPSWPPHSTPRLFVDEPLLVGGNLRVEGSQAHYLLNVMRLKEGAVVKLFDDQTGEYLARVENVAKRDLSLTIESKLRERETGPDIWLCQALIKKDRLDWIAEKACELGALRFVPILTQRCVVDKLKEDRLRAQMVEAAEQCERTALPEIAPLEKLEALLKNWPEDRTLYFCDERGGEPILNAISTQNPQKTAILIGPEGGFTDQENSMIRKCPQTAQVSLGPNILRADTAAVAAMALLMAAKG